MTSDAVAEAIVSAGRSLYDRGLATGSAGNLSVATKEGVTVTPTNSSLGRLDPDALSTMSLSGQHLGGMAPSKEAPIHLGFYRARPELRAVVHLHCTHAVAVSCLPPDERQIPPLTAYFVMHIGELGHVGYHPPGAPGLFDAVLSLAGRHHAVLLANHGPVVAGTSLTAALDAIEELEETAKIHLLLRHGRSAPLSADDIRELGSRR